MTDDAVRNIAARTRRAFIVFSDDCVGDLKACDRSRGRARARREQPEAQRWVAESLGDRPLIFQRDGDLEARRLALRCRLNPEWMVLLELLDLHRHCGEIVRIEVV